jgi:hypothetical protein
MESAAGADNWAVMIERYSTDSKVPREVVPSDPMTIKQPGKGPIG